MGMFGIVALLVAANVGLPVWGSFHETDVWVRAMGAFGANPVALTLLPVAGLRIAGSDAQNSQVPAPDTADATFAVVAGFVWIALHAAFAFAVYRRLFHIYRSRVDG